MTKVIIKHRLFTWFEDGESPAVPGETVRMERISHFGDEVDIKDKPSLERGKELDAFFSEKDAKAIRDGNYTGPEAALLASFAGRAQTPAAGESQDLEDEGPQTDNLSAEELGSYIHAHRLNVDDTVALAKDGDADSINKVLDAENFAAQARGNDPRSGVIDRLEAKLNATATSGDDQS